MTSENTDYIIGYDYAISLGKEITVVEFYAKRYAYYVEFYREVLIEVPDSLAYDTAEENSFVVATEEMNAYEQAIEWQHSDSWAEEYAESYSEIGKEAKWEAYDHLRKEAPESIFNEAYNEYISRGYSEKYAILIATELRDLDWFKGTIAETEELFDNYIRLFNEAKAKNKSDEFSDLYADYALGREMNERFAWAVCLLREQLIEQNKSEEYIENVISRLEQWDDIDEITLNEDADDHWRLFDALGYADGICFAKENHIQDAAQFADIMAGNYARCINYKYIAPVENLALYQTIIDYNKKCTTIIPISEAQTILTEELKKEIEIDNKILGS